MSKIIPLDSSNYIEAALSFDGPVMIDFWADWCNPCKALAPVIEEIAAEMPDSVRICTVDVDQNTEITRQFRVMGIPTCIFMKNGEEVQRFVNIRDKQDYIDQLNDM